MKFEDIIIESVRISSGMILSLLLLFTLYNFEFIDISEIQIFLEWVGFVTLFIFCSTFVIATIILNKDKLIKISIKEYKIYLYALIFTLLLMNVLIYFSPT